MHRFYSLFQKVVLAATIGLGCGDPADLTEPGVSSSAPAFVRASRSSVSGHVEQDITEDGIPVEKFSFHAHHLGNGQVQGRFVVKDFFAEGGKNWAKGRVTCFTVEADGKTARIGGVVTSARNPQVIGSEAVWTVVDNGEGARATRDETTDLLWGFTDPDFSAAAFHCEVGFPPDAFSTFGETLRANVQVRP
jgi:hypothetical protein